MHIPREGTTFLFIHWGIVFAFKPAQTRPFAPEFCSFFPRFPGSKASGKICSVNDLPWTRTSFSSCTEKIKNSLQWSLQKKWKSSVHSDTYCPTLLTVVPPFSNGVKAFAATLASLFLLVSLRFGRLPTGITLKWKVQLCDISKKKKNRKTIHGVLLLTKMLFGFHTILEKNSHQLCWWPMAGWLAQPLGVSGVASCDLRLLSQFLKSLSAHLCPYCHWATSSHHLLARRKKNWQRGLLKKSFPSSTHLLLPAVTSLG